ERVLVACAEVHSTALEYAPRAAAVTPYFGDGAGALVLGAAREPGVLAAVLHSDPDRLERFWCEFPASRHYPARMDREAYRAGRHYYQLDAAAVHPQAREALVAVTREVLARAGVPAERVALFLVHYLDARVAREAAEAAPLPGDRVVATPVAAGHLARAGSPEGGRAAPPWASAPRARRSARPGSRPATSTSSSWARSRPTSTSRAPPRSCSGSSGCAACRSWTCATSARASCTCSPWP